MKIGVPKEAINEETRVALTPLVAKKFLKKGFQVEIEKGAGESAGFSDQDFIALGAKIVDRRSAFGCDLVLKVNPPNVEEAEFLQKQTLLVSLMNPFGNKEQIKWLAAKGVNIGAMELVPRTSRAQAMDVLSSQANIAGYRVVLEVAQHYKQFLPMMMTSAGMAKPAKAIVLGAGVAGLQAIATLKRLGAVVEAFDVRAEVREQIESLGAKFIDLSLEEEGSGQGGYAKELSAEGQQRQQAALSERLVKADIIITTANIPGKKAPTLVTKQVVEEMREGSIIADMAAVSGGNCELTEVGRVSKHHGVTILGLSNYPALLPYDASQFYANNLFQFLGLMVKSEDGQLQMNFDFEDDIIDAVIVSHNGQVR